ncbi:hypothetical protein C8R41DRAFT_529313 [Lentinula lateritia]|uniref:Chitin synthase export chaperone n=1 Tax=Lentinula lateritia TaxID=40482 RepID=A0ABQ8VUV0_9AGAR|nr:hypothetical protein C8R41DRAFT_529313 [Lentinula lateritia]
MVVNMSTSGSAERMSTPPSRHHVLYIAFSELLFSILSTTLGISGALYRSCPLVAMFCSMIMAQLVFGIGSDHISSAFCERTPLMKYLTLVLFIQAWLIEILGLYYAQAYVQELLDEETDGMKEIDYEFDYDYAYYGEC